MDMRTREESEQGLEQDHGQRGEDTDGASQPGEGTGTAQWHEQARDSPGFRPRYVGWAKTVLLVAALALGAAALWAAAPHRAETILELPEAPRFLILKEHGPGGLEGAEQ